MTLALHNLAVYSLQIAVLVGAGALLLLVFRLENPRVRLAYWQTLLAACLLLPLLQPWKQDVIEATIAVTTLPLSAVMAPLPQAPARFPWEELIAGVLAAGAVLRLCWLGLGFLRLRRYLDRAQLYHCPLVHRTHVHAYVGLSEDVSSPVTFGLRSPVVLFPTRFAEMDPAMQDAIACHELLHVHRRDWLFTIAEEFIRAILWFHPAVWWLLGEVQLTREQVVDREVVRLMQSRDRYLEALLAIASTQVRLDLAPAPLFLRKRHLAQRVNEIVREVSMSRTRIAASIAALFCLLSTAGWLMVHSFPLQAQTITKTTIRPDASGVSVEQGEANLLHRTPIQYPVEVREKGIQGAVLLELDLDQNGNVSDARVISGPQELRRAALESVLHWHYSKQMPLPAKTQVTINFQLPQAASVRMPPPPAPRSVAMLPLQGSAAPVHIDLEGLPETLRSNLQDKLAQYEGQPMSGELMRTITKVITEEDRHLSLAWMRDRVRVMLVNEMPPPPPAAAAGVVGGVPGGVIGGVIGGVPSAEPPPPAAADGTPRIRVGGNVQQDKLISQARPVYPPLAKQARIQGVVRLSAIIGKDGTVQNLSAATGHPLLVPAAMEAVRQWVYRPTLLNGNPVEVVTQIDINFTLSE